MKNLVALLVCGVMAWLLWPAGPAVSHWSGMPAPDGPRQETGGLPTAWKVGGYEVIPLARYSVKAVVLSRETYRTGREADVSPLDLALGWGPMSDEKVIKALNITQSGRWYHYRWPDVPPLAPELIVANSANTHIIPANGTVRTTLDKVRPHALASFAGYLVEVRHPDGWKWRSSLSRNDSGGNACELMWVESVSVETP